MTSQGELVLENVQEIVGAERQASDLRARGGGHEPGQELQHCRRPDHVAHPRGPRPAAPAQLDLSLDDEVHGIGEVSFAEEGRPGREEALRQRARFRERSG